MRLRAAERPSSARRRSPCGQEPARSEAQRDRTNVSMLERLSETTTPPSLREADGAVPPGTGAARAASMRREGRVLPYFLALAVLAPLLFFGLAAFRDWQVIETEARARVIYIRDAIAEHAERVFQTHELAALSIRDRIAGMSWAEIARSEDLHAHLVAMETAFPEVQAVSLVDEDGRLRASSRAMPAPALDFSDRAWFAEIRDGEQGLIVGPRPGTSGRSDDHFTLTLPRRTEGGAFDGAIRLAITPRYFADFYATAYPDDGLIALVLEGGEILVSYPPEAELPRRVPPDARAFDRIADYRRAVWEAPSAIDGERRIHAVTRIADLPVYAAFAMSRSTLDAAWRDRVLGYAAYFVPAAAALLFLGLLVWRSHRELEEKVELRTRALSEAVAEKNQLLKEVHHRVKNNMQIVSSLIRMQERVHTSPEETIRRVQAMALVHDLIYSHGEFASVNLGAYTRRLSETLSSAGAADAPIRITHDLEHVAVTLDRAMPFALILSEVITNAMRHAFPTGTGHIAVTLERVDGDAVLRVEDDGQGFDPAARTEGFGLKLIRSLAVQLDAEVSFEPGRGAAFVMRFPLDRQAAHA